MLRPRVATLAPLVALALAASASAQAPGGPTLELARLQKGVKSRRVSSFDTTGGNNDRLEGLVPGARRELFSMKGAGVINHIWVTIAPPPPALSRHDIILRMYWDGEASPSVEAPIGDFFGQGWDESYPARSGCRPDLADSRYRRISDLRDRART